MPAAFTAAIRSVCHPCKERSGASLRFGPESSVLESSVPVLLCQDFPIHRFALGCKAPIDSTSSPLAAVPRPFGARDCQNFLQTNNPREIKAENSNWHEFCLSHDMVSKRNAIRAPQPGRNIEPPKPVTLHDLDGGRALRLFAVLAACVSFWVIVVWLWFL